MRRCCEKIPINSRNRQRLRIFTKIRRVVVRRLPVGRLHLLVKMYRELFDPKLEEVDEVFFLLGIIFFCFLDFFFAYSNAETVF